jgi:hypothetical protein
MPARDLPPWLDPYPQPPCPGYRGHRPGTQCRLCRRRHRKAEEYGAYWALVFELGLRPKTLRDVLTLRARSRSELGG